MDVFVVVYVLCECFNFVGLCIVLLISLVCVDVLVSSIEILVVMGEGFWLCCMLLLLFDFLCNGIGDVIVVLFYG